MVKIILFGKSGLLGQAVYDEFLDYELLAPTHREVDVCNKDQVYSYLSEHKPDVVINCTGYNSVDEAEEDENRNIVFDLNENAPKYMAQCCSELGCKLIHFSSDYVFDGQNPDGYKEDAKYGPVNVYGNSKMAGEKAVMENCSDYFIVRLSWLFGPWKKNFVTTMLDLASKRDELTVVNDQIGKPTYTVDVANALHRFTESTDYGIYHLPNEGAVSWYDFANEIFDITDKEIKVSPVTSDEFQRLANRPASSILINSKLPLQRPHKEALADYINNYV